jgi:hypothetical protein
MSSQIRKSRARTSECDMTAECALLWLDDEPEPSVDWCYQRLWTATLGLVSGPNQPIANVLIWVSDKPKPSIRVWFHGQLTIHLNCRDCQRVALRVYLEIDIRLLYWQCVNWILSKLRFQQPIMRFCRLCSLQNQLIWYLQFTFDILYFCLARQTIIQWCAQRSRWCLDYRVCKTENCWLSVDADSQDSAEVCSVLFGLKAWKYLINGYLQPIRTSITQDAKLWNVDIQSWNQVVTQSPYLSPIPLAITSVMNISNQITGKLPYLQGNKLLTLWWHSF